jgi:beta-glucosidase
MGMAATFNPELAYKGARVTAKDTRTAGVPWAFSPVLGLGVMPLWSRIYETVSNRNVIYIGSSVVLL